MNESNDTPYCVTWAVNATPVITVEFKNILLLLFYLVKFFILPLEQPYSPIGFLLMRRPKH